MKTLKPLGYWLVGIIVLSISYLLYLNGNFEADRSLGEIKPKLSVNLPKFDKPDAVMTHPNLSHEDKETTAEKFRLFKSATTVIDSASIVELKWTQKTGQEA